MAVERADSTPGLAENLAAPRAREAVDLSADQMAQRVAAERVAREQNHIDQHDERADSNAESRRTARHRPTGRQENVIRQDENEDDGGVHEESVQVLKDEGKARLAFIAVPSLADSTGDGIEEKCPIVRLAVVIAGGAESQGEDQDQECRR